jgi:hypothetical protein
MAVAQGKAGKADGIRATETVKHLCYPSVNESFIGLAVVYEHDMAR